MRVNGFYWVKFKGEWIVAEYVDCRWLTLRSHVIKEDLHFEEINEERLCRNELQTLSMIATY